MDEPRHTYLSGLSDYIPDFTDILCCVHPVRTATCHTPDP
jgi:hypothetical protein